MMNDSAGEHQPDRSAGLCAHCREARVIPSDRGARFIKCERARVDPSFARYPALPVVVCVGYVRRDVG
jgi:hypothetical protein